MPTGGGCGGYDDHSPRDAGGITLREWVTERFTAQQRALEMLADTQIRETRVLKDQVEKIADLHADAHAREHLLTQEALDKAEEAMERRIAGLNEFRQQLSDQASTFVRRDMVDEKLAASAERYEREFKSLSDRVYQLERASANLSGRMWALGVGVSLLVVFIQFVQRIWGG